MANFWKRVWKDINEAPHILKLNPANLLAGILKNIFEEPEKDNHEQPKVSSSINPTPDNESTQRAKDKEEAEKKEHERKAAEEKEAEEKSKAEFLEELEKEAKETNEDLLSDDHKTNFQHDFFQDTDHEIGISGETL